MIKIIKKNFSFIMVNSRSTKDNISIIKIKVDLNTQLSDIVINKQYYLCYLPINKPNIDKKKKLRNTFEDEHLVMKNLKMLKEIHYLNMIQKNI